jgi:hypothetical protein
MPDLLNHLVNAQQTVEHAKHLQHAASFLASLN